MCIKLVQEGPPLAVESRKLKASIAKYFRGVTDVSAQRHWEATIRDTIRQGLTIQKSYTICLLSLHRQVTMARSSVLTRYKLERTQFGYQIAREMGTDV
ncbi:unnamed protein product [Caretta caretta]